MLGHFYSCVEMVHTLAGMFQNVLSLNYLIQCLRKCSRMFYTYELSVIQICAVTVYSFVYLRNFVHNAQLECSTIFFLTYIQTPKWKHEFTNSWYLSLSNQKVVAYFPAYFPVVRDFIVLLMKTESTVDQGLVQV